MPPSMPLTTESARCCAPGLCRDPGRKAGRTQETHGFRVLGFHRFPSVLCGLSHPCGARRFSRAGLDRAGLLRAADITYDPGDRDCAVDFDYAASRARMKNLTNTGRSRG